jgi:hypothetical protein
VTDVLDFTSDAPGADDDGSGVAVVLELARLFATRQFPGTLVFATVAGAEQGLSGSAFMANQMAAAGQDVQGMFSNDIAGASQAFDGTRPDPFTAAAPFELTRWPGSTARRCGRWPLTPARRRACRSIPHPRLASPAPTPPR